MKRLALLTVFFYVCTFAVPQRAQAVAPVVLIAAAAVGASMMSASVGTYYAQNGVLPEYVSATAGAVASAADKIFQPSYLAVGAYSLLTPEHLSVAKDYYIGKTSALGATVGDVVDFVKNSSSGLYDTLKSLISSNTTQVPAYNPALQSIPIGAIVTASDGTKYRLTAGPTQGGIVKPADWPGWIGSNPTIPSLTNCYKYPGQNRIYYFYFVTLSICCLSPICRVY